MLEVSLLGMPVKKIKKTVHATVKKTSRKAAAPKVKRVAVARKATPSLGDAAPARVAKETVSAPGALAGSYVAAVGRRKTAVANLRFYLEAVGQAQKSASFRVNDKDVRVYFPQGNFVDSILAPLVLGNANAYAITCQVQGGGVRGQAEAIRLALCRALVMRQESRRKEFKDLGYLTRDPRMKERKKYGLKKARRAAQWSKR